MSDAVIACCRSCDTIAGLRAVGKHLFCETCRPRRCRHCRLETPLARFLGPRERTCVACRASRRLARLKVRKPAKPKPRKPPQMSCEGCCPPHLWWIRELPCAVACGQCLGRIQAHHVRRETGGGTGLRPADCWAVPLCGYHHAEGHRIGWLTFEASHHIDLRAFAITLAARSPHRPLDRQGAIGNTPFTLWSDSP